MFPNRRMEHPPIHLDISALRSPSTDSRSSSLESSYPQINPQTVSDVESSSHSYLTVHSGVRLSPKHRTDTPNQASTQDEDSYESWTKPHSKPIINRNLSREISVGKPNSPTSRSRSLRLQKRNSVSPSTYTDYSADTYRRADSSAAIGLRKSSRKQHRYHSSRAMSRVEIKEVVSDEIINAERWYTHSRLDSRSHRDLRIDTNKSPFLRIAPDFQDKWNETHKSVKKMGTTGTINILKKNECSRSSCSIRRAFFQTKKFRKGRRIYNDGTAYLKRKEQRVKSRNDRIRKEKEKHLEETKKRLKRLKDPIAPHNSVQDVFPQTEPFTRRPHTSYQRLRRKIGGLSDELIPEQLSLNTIIPSEKGNTMASWQASASLFLTVASAHAEVDDNKPQQEKVPMRFILDEEDENDYEHLYKTPPIKSAVANGSLFKLKQLSADQVLENIDKVVQEVEDTVRGLESLSDGHDYTVRAANLLSSIERLHNQIFNIELNSVDERQAGEEVLSPSPKDELELRTESSSTNYSRESVTRFRYNPDDEVLHIEDIEDRDWDKYYDQVVNEYFALKAMEAGGDTEDTDAFDKKVFWLNIGGGRCPVSWREIFSMARYQLKELVCYPYANPEQVKALMKMENRNIYSIWQTEVMHRVKSKLDAIKQKVLKRYDLTVPTTREKAEMTKSRLKSKKKMRFQSISEEVLRDGDDGPIRPSWKLYGVGSMASIGSLKKEEVEPKKRLYPIQEHHRNWTKYLEEIPEVFSDSHDFIMAVRKVRGRDFLKRRIKDVQIQKSKLTDHIHNPTPPNRKANDARPPTARGHSLKSDPSHDPRSVLRATTLSTRNSLKSESLIRNPKRYRLSDSLEKMWIGDLMKKLYNLSIQSLSDVFAKRMLILGKVLVDKELEAARRAIIQEFITDGHMISDLVKRRCGCSSLDVLPWYSIAHLRESTTKLLSCHHNVDEREDNSDRVNKVPTVYREMLPMLRLLSAENIRTAAHVLHKRCILVLKMDQEFKKRKFFSTQPEEEIRHDETELDQSDASSVRPDIPHLELNEKTDDTLEPDLTCLSNTSPSRTARGSIAQSIFSAHTSLETKTFDNNLLLPSEGGTETEFYRSINLKSADPSITQPRKQSLNSTPTETGTAYLSPSTEPRYYQKTHSQFSIGSTVEIEETDVVKYGSRRRVKGKIDTGIGYSGRNRTHILGRQPLKTGADSKPAARDLNIIGHSLLNKPDSDRIYSAAPPSSPYSDDRKSMLGWIRARSINRKTESKYWKKFSQEVLDEYEFNTDSLHVPNSAMDLSFMKSPGLDKDFTLRSFAILPSIGLNKVNSTADAKGSKDRRGERKVFNYESADSCLDRSYQDSSRSAYYEPLFSNEDTLEKTEKTESLTLAQHSTISSDIFQHNMSAYF